MPIISRYGFNSEWKFIDHVANKIFRIELTKAKTALNALRERHTTSGSNGTVVESKTGVG